MEDITAQVRAADAAAALFGGAVGLAILVFLVVLIVIWTFLPFAIFGTKPILREIAASLQRIEKLQQKTLVEPLPPQLTDAVERLRASRQRE